MAIALPLLWPRQWVRHHLKKFPNQGLMPVVTYSFVTQLHNVTFRAVTATLGKSRKTQQSSQRVDLQPEEQTEASFCRCGLVSCSAPFTLRFPQDIMN